MCHLIHSLWLFMQLYDRTHTTLLQYLQFLHMIPEQEYMKLVIPIETMWEVYQLDKETIMTFHRPILRKAIMAWDGSFLTASDDASTATDVTMTGTFFTLFLPPRPGT